MVKRKNIKHFKKIKNNKRKIRQKSNPNSQQKASSEISQTKNNVEIMLDQYQENLYEEKIFLYEEVEEKKENLIVNETEANNEQHFHNDEVHQENNVNQEEEGNIPYMNNIDEDVFEFNILEKCNQPNYEEEGQHSDSELNIQNLQSLSFNCSKEHNVVNNSSHKTKEDQNAGQKDKPMINKDKEIVDK